MREGTAERLFSLRREKTKTEWRSMTVKQKMYYVGFCRICGTGPLGLRLCGGCGNVVVLCDECDAMWTTADLTAKPHLPQTNDLSCPHCNRSLIGAPSRWANLRQIKAADWLREALESGALQLQLGSAFAPEAGKATDTEIDDVAG